MFKRCLSIILGGLLVFGAHASFVFGQTTTDDSSVSKVKAAVVKRGVNEKKRVRVKMQNGTKIRGYISQVGDDSFTLTDSKTKQPVVIAYRDVSKVESGGLSGGARIGIIVATAAVGGAIILFLAYLNAIRNN